MLATSFMLTSFTWVVNMKLAKLILSHVDLRATGGVGTAYVCACLYVHCSSMNSIVHYTILYYTILYCTILYVHYSSMNELHRAQVSPLRFAAAVPQHSLRDPRGIYRRSARIRRSAKYNVWDQVCNSVKDNAVADRACLSLRRQRADAHSATHEQKPLLISGVHVALRCQLGQIPAQVPFATRPMQLATKFASSILTPLAV